MVPPRCRKTIKPMDIMLNKLQQLDYNTLPISTYSRDYILRMLPHLG